MPGKLRKIIPFAVAIFIGIIAYFILSDSMIVSIIEGLVSGVVTEIFLSGIPKKPQIDIKK